MPPLVFIIFRVNLPRPPHQVNSVRHLRHERFSETEAPVAIFVIGGESYGVTARVGGVIPCPVIVYRPVHEAKMGVGADGIDIEKIGHAELATANFQAAT